MQQHRQLRLLRRIMEDPDMFHLTRRSVAGGTAAGLFFAFMPIPAQTILAALFSIWFRVNLPLAVALTFLTNPFTSPPVFYLAYRLGATLLGDPVQHIHIEMSWEWFSGTLMMIWPALLIGSLIFATLAAVLGFILVKLLWRLAVIQKWERRKSSRRSPASRSGSNQ